MRVYVRGWGNIEYIVYPKCQLKIGLVEGIRRIEVVIRPTGNIVVAIQERLVDKLLRRTDIAHSPRQREGTDIDFRSEGEAELRQDGSARRVHDITRSTTGCARVQNGEVLHGPGRVIRHREARWSASPRLKPFLIRGRIRTLEVGPF